MSASLPLQWMTADQRAILALLLRGPLSVPEIAVRAKLSDPNVRAALILLQRRDLVKLDGGAWHALSGAAVVLNSEARSAAVGLAMSAKAALGAAALAMGGR